MLQHPSHQHRRYIINFGDMEEQEARLWPDLFKIVEERVKPERMENNRETYRRYWWLYAERRVELRSAMTKLDQVLMQAVPSKHLALAFIPTTTVIAAPHCVFTLPTHVAFAILQGSLHELWVRFFSSSMKDDLRYTPSDCFETFPFPENWEQNPSLEAVGKEYYEYRAALMKRNQEGLTATYNRFHDPDERDRDIQKLRELHGAMDRAVLDAYGWSDIPTHCEFRLDYEEEEDEDEGPRRRKKPYRLRWPAEVHDEVLARLLDLNQKRAAAERLAGAHAEAKTQKGAAKGRRTKKAADTPSLFPSDPDKEEP